MALVTSYPQTTLATTANNEVYSDTQSQCSYDDDDTTLENHNPRGALVQNLGCPEDRSPPHVGQVSMDNCTGVTFGDQNYYHGPVTINQIVYPNGTPLVTNSEQSDNQLEGRENLVYETADSSDGNYQRDSARLDLNASDKENCDKSKSCDVPNGENQGKKLSVLRKGLIWCRDLPKRKQVSVFFFCIVVLLLLVILPTALFWKQPFEYDADLTNSTQVENDLQIVSRAEWVAKVPTKKTTPLITPVPYVIIQHTATENCSSIDQCVLRVRSIQTFHIDSRGFYDIGYNFLVGGAGSAYEGRGWNVQGAHTYGYNSRSIGIAFIGNFTSQKSPEIQILAAKKLIQKGVELGYIKEDYKLLAARQVSDTESPGATLYEDIKTWPHWVKEP